MKTIRTRLGVIQNLSLVDRLLRMVLTAVLLAWPMIDLLVLGDVMNGWHAASWLISAHVGLTAFVGWDPLYQLFGYKTCDLSERNQCGTLPYQVDAAMGHHPVPKRDFDHSLSGAGHPNRHS
ncbi:MAG: DUF2892 domain-containing protein [Gammaproteobacteria bacterium]|jgi:hypothetical protein|nr:DUF2892 domain-containing protein [Gammaproteobacteria bacterium]